MKNLSSKIISSLSILFPALFFIFVGIFWANNTPLGKPPDELAHLGYIQNVLENKSLIVDYTNATIFNSRQLNYLNHPTLYYTIMANVSAVFNYDLRSNIIALRFINILMATSGIVAVLLAARRIGLTDRYVFLSGISVVCVPMMPYLAASVNSDNLTYMGFGFAILGLTGLIKEKQDYKIISHFFLFVFLFSSVVVGLTKMTGALSLLIITVSMVFFYRQTILMIIGDKAALILIIFFSLIPLTYFIYIYLNYGTLMPAPRALYDIKDNFQGIDFVSYSIVFVDTLIKRLPIIMSHESKNLFSNLSVIFYLFILTPILGLIFSFFITKSKANLTLSDNLLIAVTLSLLLFFIIHLLMGYKGYQKHGLFAGIQPRYYMQYLPVIWVLSFIYIQKLIIFNSMSSKFIFPIIFSIVLTIVGVNLKAYSEIYNNTNYQPFERHLFYGESEVEYSFFTRSVGYIAYIDHVSYKGKIFEISGWSYDTKNNLPISNVILFMNKKYLTMSTKMFARPDVSKSLGNKKALFSGFRLKINFSDYKAPADICDIKIYAVFFDGTIGLIKNKSCD